MLYNFTKASAALPTCTSDEGQAGYLTGSSVGAELARNANDSGSNPSLTLFHSVGYKQLKKIQTIKNSNCYMLLLVNH